MPKCTDWPAAVLAVDETEQGTSLLIRFPDTGRLFLLGLEGDAPTAREARILDSGEACALYQAMPCRLQPFCQ